MAKSENKLIKKGFSLQGFDVDHLTQIEEYVKAVDQLYQKAVAEYAQLASKIKLDPEKPFRFADYPQTKAKAQEIVDTLSSRMRAVIVEGSTSQWNYANKKNDAFLESIADTSKLSKKTLEKFQDRNLEALKAFQSRKVNGIDLSDRVWKYTSQLKKTMELGIDVALGQGTSAQELSKDLRKLLVEPDRLFRRVRDKRGQLHLSRNAQAFNPGQGVYRSSYKNAMRLTRSEINMAYRTSDQLRWKQLDFVVGYEVRLSNNHTLNGVPFVDICDFLKGKYPKDFKFVGWHPQCRCQAFPILMDPQEFDTDELNELQSALNGTEYKKYDSKNKITDVPKSFKDWIEENKDRASQWSSQPYFIRQNFVGGKIEGGLSFSTSSITKTDPIKIGATDPTNVEKPAPNTLDQSYVPEVFRKGSDYVKGTEIEISNDFFKLLDPNRPVTLKLSKGSQSYHQAGNVVIGMSDRWQKSVFYKEKIIYHEYGHAIDFQRNLRYSDDVKSLMDKYRKIGRQKITYVRYVRDYDYNTGAYKYVKRSDETAKLGAISHRLDLLHAKISRISDSSFKKRGISRADVLEAIGSTQDTIMSLNPNYGWGHTKSYFKRIGMKEAEFLAHSFENAFGGNPIFKKYLPELYEDTIKYIKSLK